MCSTKVSDFNSLQKEIAEIDPSILIVEGYNGVGKSRVIYFLQNYLAVHAYRPNYVGWFSKVPKKFRWLASLSFLDILKDQQFFLSHKLLLDRGFISGAVYNNDMELALEYKDVVEDMSILHILVTCDRESYEKFYKIRGGVKPLSYDDYLIYTERYKIALQLSNLPYIEFINHYSEEFEEASKTCRGCGHYNISDSCCKHPRVNKKVSADQERCIYSEEIEVQDYDGELFKL